MLLKKVYTLVFLQTDSKVLLGWKKRGFGLHKWNGFGGKVEPNESVIIGAARELREECCVTVKTSDLKNVGHLEFVFEGDPVMMEVRVFTARVFAGTPAETEEMTPKWFSYDKIPFSEMWADDKFWFPYILKEKPFYARFNYQGFDKIVSYDLEEVESMESFYNTRKD